MDEKQVFGGDKMAYTFVDGEPYVKVKDITAVLDNAAVGMAVAAITGANRDASVVSQGILTIANHLSDYRSHRLEVEAAKSLS